MKKLLLISILSLSIFTSQALAVASQGYGMLQDMVSIAMGNQNSIDMYRLFVNAALNDVNTECSSTAVDTECEVNNEITFAITPQMATLSGGNLTAGQNIILTAGALTYKKLSTGKYNHSIKVKTNKIKINGVLVADVSTEVFRWTDSGIDKAISFVGTDATGTYNEKFAMTTVNGANTFIGNGTFTSTANDVFKYKAKLQQYNIDTNGIKINTTVEFKLAGGSPVTFSLLAKADNTGGYIKTKYKSGGIIYEEEETFDANSNRTGYKHQVNNGGWTTESAVNTGDYAVADGDIEGGATIGIDNPDNPTTTSVNYIVVKHGVTPSEETVIGIGDFYDNDASGSIQVAELHFDYFGDEANLADNGAVADTDDLDIYDISDVNNPVQVTGIFLTK